MKVDLIASTSEHISESAVNDGHPVVAAGATFIVVRGMILQHTFPVCRGVVPMAFNQDVKALIPSERLRPEYLTLWCRWAAPRLLRLVSETTHGTKRLEFDRLASVPFSGAALPAQDEFLADYARVTAPILDIQRRCTSVDQVYDAVIAKVGLS